MHISRQRFTIFLNCENGNCWVDRMLVCELWAVSCEGRPERVWQVTIWWIVTNRFDTGRHLTARPDLRDNTQHTCRHGATFDTGVLREETCSHLKVLESMWDFLKVYLINNLTFILLNLTIVQIRLWCVGIFTWVGLMGCYMGCDMARCHNQHQTTISVNSQPRDRAAERPHSFRVSQPQPVNC